MNNLSITLMLKFDTGRTSVDHKWHIWGFTRGWNRNVHWAKKSHIDLRVDIFNFFNVWSSLLATKSSQRLILSHTRGCRKSTCFWVPRIKISCILYFNTGNLETDGSPTNGWPFAQISLVAKQNWLPPFLREAGCSTPQPPSHSKSLNGPYAYGNYNRSLFLITMASTNVSYRPSEFTRPTYARG